MIERLRAWAERHSDEGRYTPVGIAFHWIMAALVLFQLGWGFYTSSFVAPGGDKLFAYQVHSAVGLPILFLAIGRLAWRTIIPGPINDADNLGWQTTIAHITHILFYICFFGLPLSGWVMWSSVAAPGPLHLAGIVPWPVVPLERVDLTLRWAIMDVAEDVHIGLVLLLALLVPAHVGAALKHHFWNRHDVLSGMLPEIPDHEDAREAPLHKPTAPSLPQESGAG
ncbi:MAG: cytochrome b/b6 domain-containing protein [Pseudomonadota bacterium]|nr:cytochrome b/b6 domain-containing protein [Pseudomonadota bacterium]